MTSNIVIEMGYAADLHRAALIATGVVLLEQTCLAQYYQDFHY